MSEAGLPSSQTVVVPTNAVVVNGAAVALITSIAEGIRADMRAMEIRMGDDLKMRLEAHDGAHALARTDSLDFRQGVRDRLDDLETIEDEERLKDVARKARRDGQLSLFNALISIFEKHGRWIILILFALFGIGASFIGGLQIRVGP